MRCSSDEGPVIFTIGYEGRTPEEYTALLAENGVKCLCDVRRDPVSRKPGFSKKRLAAACEAAGIVYRHFPDLGIEREKRRAVVSAEDGFRLLDGYEKILRRGGDVLLEGILGLLAEHGRIALTCYEADITRCHRGRLAPVLAERAGGRVRVVHL